MIEQLRKIPIPDSIKLLDLRLKFDRTRYEKPTKFWNSDPKSFTLKKLGEKHTIRPLKIYGDFKIDTKATHSLSIPSASPGYLLEDKGGDRRTIFATIDVYVDESTGTFHLNRSDDPRPYSSNISAKDVIRCITLYREHWKNEIKQIQEKTAL